MFHNLLAVVTIISLLHLVGFFLHYRSTTQVLAHEFFFTDYSYRILPCLLSNFNITSSILLYYSRYLGIPPPPPPKKEREKINNPFRTGKINVSCCLHTYIFQKKSLIYELLQRMQKACYGICTVVSARGHQILA